MTVPDPSEISRHSLVETQRVDEQLSLRLEAVEAQTTIPHLSEQEKMRVMQMLVDDLDRVNNDAVGSGWIVREVWNATANITSNAEWHRLKFSEKHMAAMKLYAAGLFCELFDRERAGKDVDILRIGEAYFSSSDLITDHVGGYDSSLELFSLSRQSEAGRRQGSSIVAGLIYDGTYYRHISEDLSQAWQAQGAVEGQLNMLTALDYLQKAAIGEIYPTETMQKAILTMMGSIADDPKSSPFVARVAGVMIDNIKEEANVEWVYLDELPSEEAEQIMRLHAERQKEFLKEQEELHTAFPDFPHDAYLYRIAKDACVQLDQGELGKLITISGEKANLHRPWNESVSGLSDKDIRLLKEAHQPRVLDSIELESGLDMKSLPLDVQARFFRFMAESDGRSYGRLVAALSRLEEQREVFAEAFLATEFGDDLGDILLDLTETTDAIELCRATESIAAVRTSSRVIAEHFKSEESLDMVIAERIPTAFTKRVTEMLALARQDGMDAVIGSLDAVAQASSELAESLKRGVFRQVDMTTNFGSFGAEEFPVTITARPNGNNARLGFTVRGMGVTGKERLNIRLDYEEGRLSLDIGSGAKQGVNASDIARKVGADLARGELALSNFRGAQAALHGNHIREPFEDMPDLYSEEFAGVVNRFIYRLRLNDSTHSQIAA